MTHQEKAHQVEARFMEGQAKSAAYLTSTCFLLRFRENTMLITINLKRKGWPIQDRRDVIKELAMQTTWSISLLAAEPWLAGTY